MQTEETVDAEVKPSARAKRARQGGSGPQCGAGKWAAEGAGKGQGPSILRRGRTLQRGDVFASRRAAVSREGAAIKVAPQECFQNACPCITAGAGVFLFACAKGKSNMNAYEYFTKRWRGRQASGTIHCHTKF